MNIGRDEILGRQDLSYCGDFGLKTHSLPTCQTGLRTARKLAHIGVIGGVMLFALSASAAAPTPAPMPSADTKLNPSGGALLGAYCARSTLTAEKFLDMIYKLFEHGTIADVAFFEKTLGVRFAKTSSSAFHYYKVSDIEGAPIDLSLSLTADPELLQRTKFVGIFRIDIHAYADCLRLTPKMIESRFGGGWFVDFEPHPAPDTGRYINVGGIDRSNIQVSERHRNVDQMVETMSIVQGL